MFDDYLGSDVSLSDDNDDDDAGAHTYSESVIFQLPLVQAQPRVDPDSAGSHGVVGGVVSVIVVLAILVIVLGLVHRYCP